ncbi:MAG TPA: DUF4126 family protein [Solirubrobacteraceae bacterium]|jgi:hypothetical protein|nr:DUF4126 family protein [Solirubrobacteraceae bacterium]
MHGTFFDIGLGAGLAAACGLRPFLPVLLAGALASGKALDVSFAHDPFRFLQDDWWLLVVVVVLVLAYALQLLLGLSGVPESGARREQRADPLAASLTGLAFGGGAVLFAGTLAAHGEVWWPGLIGGLAAVAISQRAVLPLFARARARLQDGAAKQALTVYLDAASLLLAALVSLLHPLGYLALALLVWMLLRTRARGDEKYAGLRVLRR